MTNAGGQARWGDATQAELDHFGFSDPYHPRFVHTAVFGTKMSGHPMRWPDIVFHILEEVNPDVVGWVRMGDSPIDYPVVAAHLDGGYYLNHNFSGDESLHGAVSLTFGCRQRMGGRNTVAKPGESEHQTGLAFDVSTWKGPFLSDANAQYRTWVAERCWDYGLIIRYPQGRERVTGVPAEPWHLRYVGRDVALEMHKRGCAHQQGAEGDRGRPPGSRGRCGGWAAHPVVTLWQRGADGGEKHVHWWERENMVAPTCGNGYVDSQPKAYHVVHHHAVAARDAHDLVGLRRASGIRGLLVCL